MSAEGEVIKIGLHPFCDVYKEQLPRDDNLFIWFKHIFFFVCLLKRFNVWKQIFWSYHNLAQSVINTFNILI